MFTPYTDFSNFFTVCRYLGIHVVMEALHDFLSKYEVQDKFHANMNQINKPYAWRVHMFPYMANIRYHHRCEGL